MASRAFEETAAVDVHERYESADFASVDPFTVSILAPKDQLLALEMAAASRMVAEADAAARIEPLPRSSERLRVLTLLHSCLPWLPGGYSGRTHGLMRALRARGAVLVPLTRAGFLAEMRSKLSAAEHPNDLVQDVLYQHIDSPRRRKDGEYQYMEQSIPVYERAIEAFRPHVIHLRSSYPSALPGLIAAKRYGIPTLYEVSGLWELVYEGREEFAEARRARVLESAVLRNTERVLSLTSAMKNLLQQDYWALRN